MTGSTPLILKVGYSQYNRQGLILMRDVATDWANAEVRSFTLASDMSGDCSLGETEGSRKRRGCVQPALTKEQQLELRDTVLKTWIEWGVIGG